MNELEFYNQQREKYGGYDHGSYGSRTFDLSNPEDYFADCVHRFSSKEKTLVDLGCGDGRFTTTLAHLNQQVIGVEPSNLIDVAYDNGRVHGVDNLTFLRENAESLSLPDSSIDIAISRRGPNPAKEIARVLKAGGVFAFITIGEQDCNELKEIVGRGQHYGDASNVTKKLDDMFQAQGFETLESKEFLYTEHYESKDALVDFLYKVPIFDDFSARDYAHVAEYSEKHGDKAVPLHRHRVVFLARLGA